MITCDPWGLSRFPSRYTATAVLVGVLMMTMCRYARTDVFLVCFALDQKVSLSNLQHKWEPEIRKYCPGVSYDPASSAVSLLLADKVYVADAYGESGLL